MTTDVKAVDVADVPLVVDLDGTLTMSDTLHEGVCHLLLRSPFLAPSMLSWLLRGRHVLKQEVASRTSIEPSLLPYHPHLLTRLREEASRRRLILCTGANERTAHAVASHLGLFDEVMASNGSVNLTGDAKAQVLVEALGRHGFDYVGDSVDDIAVFALARHAWVVNPSRALRQAIPSLGNVREQFPTPHGLGGAIWRALRPHQWIKNVLVFVPLLTATGVDLFRGLRTCMWAFLAFCVIASSVYLVNDVIDAAADRAHPRKKRRPIASGALPMLPAVLLAAVLFGIGLTNSLAIGPAFAGVVVMYLLVTWSYMIWLKRVPILDSIVLATLYTLRIIAGAAALSVVPSFWLMGFSVFFFMSLALGKRYAELLELEENGHGRSIPGRKYRPEDLATLLAQGNATGCAAVVVLALYVHSGIEPGQYRYPELLWVICLLLLYWISKFWLNAQRRELDEDPVIWAANNRVSRGIAALAIALVAAARWLPRA